MIVVASTLGKTSLIRRLRGVLDSMKGKGIVIVITLFVVTILLSQLMGQIACLSIMLLFCTTLDEDSVISPSRMLFAVCTLNTIWTAKIPLAMGATMPGTINSYQGIAGDQLIGIADYFKAAIPGLLGLIYCLLFYKLIPSQSINTGDVKEVKEEKPISNVMKSLSLRSLRLS